LKNIEMKNKRWATPTDNLTLRLRHIRRHRSALTTPKISKKPNAAIAEPIFMD